MVTGVFIPPEIIEEILYRLCVKALGRFKCVSKQWKALISCPRFINTHLDFSHRLQHEKLILLWDVGSFYAVDLVDLKNNPLSSLVAERLRSLPWIHGFICMGDSINGLTTVTLGDENGTELLINPTTGEYMEVSSTPDLHRLLPNGYSIVHLEVNGIGYDSLTDGYKSVEMFRCKVENMEGCVQLLVVHSLRSNSWRLDLKPPPYRALHLKAVYANGCVHWICIRDIASVLSSFIAVFNVQTEEFEEMGLPSFVLHEEVTIVNPLVVVNGCLCVVTFREDDFSVEIWVMKEYGVMESWKKISVYGLGTSVVEPLCFLGDREVVLKVNDYTLLVYNVDEKTQRDLTISGIPCIPFQAAGMCVESLYSPKYGNRLELRSEG